MPKINYSRDAKGLLKIACRRARAAESPYVGKEHVALALFDYAKGFAVEAMLDIGLPIASIYEFLHMSAKARNNVSEEEESDLVDAIEGIAERYGCDYIGTEHILIALIEGGNEHLNKFISKTSVAVDDFIAYLGGEKTSLEAPDAKLVPIGGMVTSRDTSILGMYGTDLTNRYLEGIGDPIIGRDKEVERAIKILCRKSKNNPLLIGEAGVGKTAIAEGVAQRIAQGDVPMELTDSKVISLDIFAMLGGTMYRGQFEDKVTNLLREIENYFGNVVLFIDEIHNIVGAGASNSEDSGDLSNILKPALSRGELSCIGATTVREYEKYIEKDAALERRFQRIFVEEPSHEDTLAILRGLRSVYSEYHNVKISTQILGYIINKCDSLVGRFPDKAIDVLDESCVEARVKASKKMPRELLQREREIDQLLVNAVMSGRVGEEDYFVAKKLSIIEEAEKKSRGILSSKHVDLVLRNRSYDMSARSRVGFR